ncbi:MAG TPA: hypothetical protein VFD10_08915 [Atribacterota bacterium]|nr:hypothetical protein [Atribacterota bacterium]
MVTSYESEIVRSYNIIRKYDKKVSRIKIVARLTSWPVRIKNSYPVGRLASLPVKIKKKIKIC